MPQENKPAKSKGQEAPFDQYAGPSGKTKLEMRQKVLERNAKNAAQERKITELSKSPDILLKLGEVLIKAEKASLIDVEKTLKSLSEYDKGQIDVLNASVELLEEIAEARAEKAIWLDRQKELEDAQTAEIAKDAKLKAGYGQVSSAAGNRAGQTGWTGGGRYSGMPGSMAEQIARGEEHERQLADRGVSQETISVNETLERSREQIAVRKNQPEIGPPPMLPKKNENPAYSAELGVGYGQVGSIAGTREGTTDYSPAGGRATVMPDSMAGLQAAYEKHEQQLASRGESAETRGVRETLSRSREQIAQNVGREAAERIEEARAFHQEHNEGWRLPKGEAPTQEKPKSVWGRFVKWLQKGD